MVSQSLNGFPKYGFSIIKWFPKIWFLNQKMVSQNMVSQSKNGFQKYGFSIKKWFPKIWFLNQKMVSQNMVSQSKNGKLYIYPKIWFLNQKMENYIFIQKYGFSIKKWKTIYLSKNMVSQSKNGFPKYGFSIKKWFLSRGSQSFYGTHLVVSITFIKYNDLYVFSNI